MWYKNELFEQLYFEKDRKINTSNTTWKYLDSYLVEQTRMRTHFENYQRKIEAPHRNNIRKYRVVREVQSWKKTLQRSL